MFSWQVSTNWRASWRDWKPTMSLANIPSTIESRMEAGSTFQYCGAGHGMWTKCSMVAAGSRSRTRRGAR
jgi:hypothetical protein